MIKFSILVPAYKRKFFKQCIDSILSQTYQNFEIIIVNDASPEHLEDVVEQYHDQRIKYFVNEHNCGAANVVKNWNICLQHASGDFVICMGDDDMLMPDCLLAYYQLICESPEIDAFHMRVREIDSMDKLIQILPARPEHESLYSAIIERINGRKHYIGDYCYRMKKLQGLGGFYDLQYAWGSDDITSYLCGNPNGIVNCNKPLFCYRTSRYSISSSNNFAGKLKSLKHVEAWLYEFVAGQSPKTEIQEDELRRLQRNLPNYFQNSSGFVLYDIFTKNKFAIFKWLFLPNGYGISKKTVLKSIIHLFK